MTDENTIPPSSHVGSSKSSLKRRNLIGACLAHALHDGYTDLLYVLLPLWKTEFGLSYAGLGIIRALYYGTMGGLQVPGNHLISRFDPRKSLVLATLVAAAGYMVVALPFGFAGLCAGLVVAGIGSSVQHPRASILVTNTYGAAARGPLGIYNFSGDLGKSIFPAVVALLLPVLAWRPVSVLYGTVPELVPKGDTGHAFALFYTGVIVSGGLAPIVYGVIADHSSRNMGILASALTALAVVPFVLALRPFLTRK